MMVINGCKLTSIFFHGKRRLIQNKHLIAVCRNYTKPTQIWARYCSKSPGKLLDMTLSMLDPMVLRRNFHAGRAAANPEHNKRQTHSAPSINPCAGPALCLPCTPAANISPHPVALLGPPLHPHLTCRAPQLARAARPVAREALASGAALPGQRHHSPASPTASPQLILRPPAP